MTQAVGEGVEIPTGAVPDWVHLLPIGPVIRGIDGREWRVGDTATVARKSLPDRGRPLPIDYDHATDLSANSGVPAPAAGWIVELQARPDGLWGRVEWTADGRAAVAGRKWRYLSPVFDFRRGDGAVIAVRRAALTNAPNLDTLTALNSRGGNAPMTDNDDGATLAAVRQTLGLHAEADGAVIIAAVSSLQDAANTSKALNAAGVDPRKHVPIGLLEEALRTIAALNKGSDEKTAVQVVETAMNTGKLPPFLKDWAIALCRSDRAAFDQFIGRTCPNGKSFMGLGEEITAFNKAAPWLSPNNNQDDDRREIMSRLGHEGT